MCFICHGGGLFDDPLVFVPRAYRCLYSPSLCCFFFGATSMSARTAPLYGRDVIAELSATLVHLSGAANLWDARVGHLLAQWSVSSPHCKAPWEQATVEGGHKVVRAAEDAAIREYAEPPVARLRRAARGPSLLGSITCNRATLCAIALTGHIPSCSLCGAMRSPAQGRTLTYATPSLLPVLLLLFLEKLEGHFDQFYPKPKLLGPHGQHPRFVVAEIWANRDM